MPGTVIREKNQAIPRGLPTDTGVYFLAGPSEKGRVGVAEKCRNVSDVLKKVGSRQTTSLAWDMIETFFGEGGSLLYFSRIAGPNPVKASVNLLDEDDAVSLVFKAKSEGVWGNALNAGVVAGDSGTEFRIRVTHDTDDDIDVTSPSFATQTDAVEWSKNLEWGDLVVGASAADPVVVAPASLTGGTDDFNNINDDTAEDALAAFTKNLGPGQIGFAGRTTATAHGQLRTHGLAFNRRPLYDHADTTVKATLLTAITNAKELTNGRVGAMFGPWVTIPALIPGGADRPVPASAAVAGVIARNDSQGLFPNDPAAGDNGVLQYANGVRATFSDDDADELNDAGFNVIKSVPTGTIQIYGYRAATDKETAPLDWQFGHQRLFMAVAAKADNILHQFVLKRIDGRGLLFKDLQGRLSAMLDTYGDAFYGEPGERFYVDVDSVNTSETIRNGEIHAAIELVMSPMGELVILDIVKKQISG